MKNFSPLLLIFIFICASCSPMATEYIPMKDEKNGFMYAMGLKMTRNSVTVSGISPQIGGKNQRLKYTLVKTNMGKKGIPNFIRDIQKGDTTIFGSKISKRILTEIIPPGLKYQSPDLGSNIMNWGFCGEIPRDPLEIPPPNIWIISVYSYELNLAEIPLDLFVPKGVYLSDMKAPDGNILRMRYTFEGNFLDISQEYVMKSEDSP